MAPAEIFADVFCSEHEACDEFNFLELRASAIASYHYPFLPEPETINTNLLLSSSEEKETRENKKLKRTFSVAESLGSNNYTSGLYSGSGNSRRRWDGDELTRCSSTNSLNSLPRLHFRDHIWTYTQRYYAAEAVEEAILSSEEGRAKDDSGTDGMRLVHLLIACAEAVACRDKLHASALLTELRANALVFGSSFQRVASCFVQGLADRLTLVQPLGAVGFVSPTMSIMDTGSDKKEEALRLVYEICPHIQFGHLAANLSILEAFEGESSVHVVDLGMSLGLPGGRQWRQLIHSLANRSGVPLRLLRITAVGLQVEQFRIIGEELEAYAESLGVNLDFSVVKSSLDNLNPEEIEIQDGEALVVNSILQLHCVVKESRGALNSVLRIIHKLAPKILVLVEQDSSHNGPFFLGRFMEALHYYSAIFDSLDALLPKYDTRRAKMEQFYFAEEIKNIVSCEGPARVERHERVDQWRRRMSRAQFQPAPMKTISQVKQWMANANVSEGYTIVEEKGCLIMGWNSKPIIAASCWKC